MMALVVLVLEFLGGWEVEVVMAGQVLAVLWLRKCWVEGGSEGCEFISVVGLLGVGKESAVTGKGGRWYSEMSYSANNVRKGTSHTATLQNNFNPIQKMKFRLLF